jgi:hypothetical protein
MRILWQIGLLRPTNPDFRTKRRGCICPDAGWFEPGQHPGRREDYFVVDAVCAISAAYAFSALALPPQFYARYEAYAFSALALPPQFYAICIFVAVTIINAFSAATAISKLNFDRLPAKADLIIAELLGLADAQNFVIAKMEAVCGFVKIGNIIPYGVF